MTLPPIPPSDSLYKFTAIGGLILVVLSLYAPWKMISDLKLAELEMDLESEKVDIESKILDIESKSLDRALQGIGSAIQDVTSALQDMQEQDVAELQKNSAAKTKQSPRSPKRQALATKLAGLKSNLEQLKSEQRQIGSKSKQHLLLLAQSTNALKKLRFLKSQANELAWISRITSLIGLIMTIWGFWNWYFKFQVYQDQIIRARSGQWTTPRSDNEQDEVPG